MFNKIKDKFKELKINEEMQDKLNAKILVEIEKLKMQNNEMEARLFKIEHPLGLIQSAYNCSHNTFAYSYKYSNGKNIKTIKFDEIYQMPYNFTVSSIYYCKLHANIIDNKIYIALLDKEDDNISGYIIDINNDKSIKVNYDIIAPLLSGAKWCKITQTL